MLFQVWFFCNFGDYCNSLRLSGTCPNRTVWEKDPNDPESDSPTPKNKTDA